MRSFTTIGVTCRELWGTADGLSDSLNVPLRTVRDVLGALQEAGIVRPCGEPMGAVQIGRPMEQIRVSDVLLALRGTRDTALAVRDVAREVAGALDEVDKNTALASEAHNLRDLVDALRPGSETAPEESGVDPHGADS